MGAGGVGPFHIPSDQRKTQNGFSHIVVEPCVYNWLPERIGHHRQEMGFFRLDLTLPRAAILRAAGDPNDICCTLTEAGLLLR